MSILMRRKRGMSPIIATVLLIAFAVAVGTVVMDLGLGLPILNEKKPDGNGGAEDICSDVELYLYEIAESPQVCFDGTQVSITIQNGAHKELNGLKVIIDGAADFKTYELIDGMQIGKADLKRINLPYENATYGSIRKIQVIPIIQANEGNTPCSLDRALVIETVLSCEEKPTSS